MTDASGLAADDHRDHGTVMQAVLASPEATEEFGRCLARVCRAGDLIILTGDLGAGKTTLTRGLGAGLGVRGPVTSPTFVVARRHPHPEGGVDLVHVDAYRLGSRGEVDDLDLWDSAGTAITVVEWGADRVEHLSDDRLHIELSQVLDDSKVLEDPQAMEDPQARRITVRPVGARWSGSSLLELAHCLSAGTTP
jgi:tRNA threonylcarbamoyladenosine biosynthesis protein TsaE